MPSKIPISIRLRARMEGRDDASTFVCGDRPVVMVHVPEMPPIVTVDQPIANSIAVVNRSDPPCTRQPVEYLHTGRDRDDIVVTPNTGGDRPIPTAKCVRPDPEPRKPMRMPDYNDGIRTAAFARRPAAIGHQRTRAGVGCNLWRPNARRGCQAAGPRWPLCLEVRPRRTVSIRNVTATVMIGTRGSAGNASRRIQVKTACA